MRSLRQSWNASWLIAWLFAVAPARGELDIAEGETFFELKIRPVLADTCLPCHIGEKPSRGLRVDSREALLKGGESGPAIVPGEPDNSLLIAAFRHPHPTSTIPSKKKLNEETVADFVKWIRQGAVWPESKKRNPFPSKPHWAFDPVKTISPPLNRSSWSDHPIDRFIEAKHNEQHLKPVPLTDKRTLIRRVHFDLIGLPPTPQEVESFLADKSRDAYAQLVDRLLGSPRYGERWGRHWFDVVRYADTAGDNADYPIPEARLYRDYVIDSFNADKPYDQFVREQIAGDILAKLGPNEKFAERVAATGFLALSRRYATAPFELMHLTIEDSIEATGRAFMGLTLRCARCHDHKYDPVTQKDYYALYGFFASTQYPFAGSEEFESKKFDRTGFQSLLPPEQAAPQFQAYQQKLQMLQAEIKQIELESDLGKKIAELKSQIETKTKEVDALEKANQNADAPKKELAALNKERDETNKQLEAKLKPMRSELRRLQRLGVPETLLCAYAITDAKPVDAPIQIRGEPNELGPPIKRGVPKFLSRDVGFDIPDGSSGRLQLAQWLTRPEHPLTARVMVNRIWQHHFGKGIVATPSNFGLRGDAPTHPELLDYLARRFIESGWSIKAIHRLILLSKTYQLSSAYQANDAARDPANKSYWRFDRRRLDAESIRDAMLAVAGNLDLTRPGAHPFPKIENWHWTQHNPFKAVYDSNHRSVYLMTQRIQRHPYLALFDAPDANTSTDVRAESTVPLQALYLMNNKFVQEQAAAFAQRLVTGAKTNEERIQHAYELAWSRPATSKEIRRAVQFLGRYRMESANCGVAEDKLEMETWTSYARVLLTANEFFYVD